MKGVFQDWRSVVNYPLFGDKKFMSKFDMSIGYSFNYTMVQRKFFKKI